MSNMSRKQQRRNLYLQERENELLDKCKRFTKSELLAAVYHPHFDVSPNDECMELLHRRFSDHAGGIDKWKYKMYLVDKELVSREEVEQAEKCHTHHIKKAQQEKEKLAKDEKMAKMKEEVERLRKTAHLLYVKADEVSQEFDSEQFRVSHLQSEVSETQQSVTRLRAQLLRSEELLNKQQTELLAAEEKFSALEEKMTQTQIDWQESQYKAGVAGIMLDITASNWKYRDVVQAYFWLLREQKKSQIYSDEQNSIISNFNVCYTRKSKDTTTTDYEKRKMGTTLFKKFVEEELRLDMANEYASIGTVSTETRSVHVPICTICQGLPEIPVEFPNSMHVYCAQCIENWARTKGITRDGRVCVSCPTTRSCYLYMDEMRHANLYEQIMREGSYFLRVPFVNGGKVIYPSPPLSPHNKRERWLSQIM